MVTSFSARDGPQRTDLGREHLFFPSDMRVWCQCAAGRAASYMSSARICRTGTRPRMDLLLVDTRDDLARFAGWRVVPRKCTDSPVVRSSSICSVRGARHIHWLASRGGAVQSWERHHGWCYHQGTLVIPRGIKNGARQDATFALPWEVDYAAAPFS